MITTDHVATQIYTSCQACCSPTTTSGPNGLKTVASWFNSTSTHHLCTYNVRGAPEKKAGVMAKIASGCGVLLKLGILKESASDEQCWMLPALRGVASQSGFQINKNFMQPSQHRMRLGGRRELPDILQLRRIAAVNKVWGVKTILPSQDRTGPGGLSQCAPCPAILPRSILTQMSEKILSLTNNDAHSTG